MKKIYLLSLVVIASAMYLFTSCTKTEIDDVVMLPDGNSARVSLNFDVKSSVDVTTRAAQSEYYEYLVNNIYILIFNGNSRITLNDNPNDINGNVNYFSPLEIKDYINKADDKGNTQSSGTIEFGAISGAGLKICAVANLGVSNSMTRADFDEDALTKDLAKFDAINTYAEFKAMELELRTHTVTRGASFIMTGEKDDVTLQAYTGNPSEITKITIPLSRTDSKITFNVTAENKNNYQDFQFIPLKWRVVNVPTVSYVLPHIENSNATATLAENLDATNDAIDAEFFSIPAEEAILFEGAVKEGETSVENSGTFTFYMYENLKAPKKEINSSDATAYALREKQVKTETSSGVTGQRFVNGDYEYAPKFATYVVFTGQISYTETDDDGNERYVLADVEYSVHLGHGSNTNVNSYNTLRNHHYTYNVKVTGINDLIVEVESNNPETGQPSDEERRPGAEGDIVMSASQIVEVDGHYDRALITLSAEEANMLFFAISTPWERGLDTNDFLSADNTTMRDYKWVKFLIHDDNLRVADGNFAAYPGDQCYDGGKTPDGTAAQSTVYGQKEVTLRDVRQLSTHFKNHPLSDGQNVTITMFIDEYLYYYDPTSDPMTTPENTKYKGVRDLKLGDPDLLLWKKSVNNEPRLMHIVKAGDMTYSADGETSLSRSVVTIKQKPIISIYNTSASDDFLKSAWGTETINETPRLTTNRTSYPTQTTNYYANAQTNNSTTNRSGSISWANAISSTERYGLGQNYTDPSYACAMRNRDFNGDGIINQNEILWYLAALEQMTGLWIADPIMPNDAKLYDPQNPDGYYADPDYKVDSKRQKTPATHYVTSTLSGNYPYVYWAEEYGATSTKNMELNYAKAPMTEANYSYAEKIPQYGSTNYENYNQYTVVSLRCLRNMGMPYGNTDEPQPYYEVTQPVQGVVTENDVTDEVLADGVANASEYDRRGENTVNESDYKGPDRNSGSWVNDTKENAYGKVVRRYYYGRYSYTYYNYSYYKTESSGSIDGSITLPYINKGALRTSPDNGGNSLPYAHIDDIGENNRPFTGFFVQSNSISNISWNKAYNSEVSQEQTNKVCPKGYRVPNQREMLLMSELITSGWSGTYVILNGQYLSDRTGSNFGAFFYYSGESRIGRELTTLNANGLADTTPGGNSMKVRCVKDNPAAKHSSSSDFNEGGEG